jgi:hypothetical protein
MLIDATLGPLESAAAAGAEKSGYAGIFTGELNNDPFLPLALAAGATDRIDIGTSIAVAFSRSPSAGIVDRVSFITTVEHPTLVGMLISH